jgi:WD40 repeat protein
MTTAAIGCGKTTPSTSDASGSPPAGDSKKGQPPSDPNAGKSKDSVKTLSPRAVIKTGFGRDEAAQNRLFLTPDGKLLAVGFFDAKKTQIWDTGGEPKKLKEFPGALMAYSPDGKLFVRIAQATGYEVVNAESGTVVATLPTGSSRFHFRSPDVLVAVGVGSAGAGKNRPLVIKEYNAATGQEKSSLDVPYSEQVDYQVGFNGGQDVAVGSGKVGRIELWNATTKKRTREISLGKPDPNSTIYFTLSPDGKWAVTAGGIVDGKTGAVVATPPSGAIFGHFVPGRDVYLAKLIKTDTRTGQVNNGYHALDINKKAVVAFLPFDGVKTAFSADGKVMVTQNNNGDLQVWDLTQLP